MKKLLSAGVAALSVLSASAAHATQIWCAVDAPHQKCNYQLKPYQIVAFPSDCDIVAEA
jgi:hypothetical protein